LPDPGKIPEPSIDRRPRQAPSHQTAGHEAAGDALLVCDPAGKLVYLNEDAERLLGLDRQLLVGRTLDSVLNLRIPEDERPAWERLVAPAPAADGDAVERLHCMIEDARGERRRVVCERVPFPPHTALVITPERQTGGDSKILAYRANFDTLTGLPNRAALQERLTLMHRSARSLDGHYGLLLLDLDHFKMINDRFGHAAGDRVLAAVGRRLSEQVRGHDTIGRWGGEEFLCLLPQVDRTQAAEIAERVRSSIAAAPVEHARRHIRVTASIGAVAFPADGADPDTLLAKADSALYEAKRSGRNAVRCHTSDSANVFSLANLIEHALTTDRVQPAFQPVVDLSTGERRGEEALARIRRPDGGWMAAADFIPAAEQLNLVHRIDHRIIQRAVQRCVRRTLKGESPAAMFVNFSADFLRHRDLVLDVLGEIKQQCARCEGRLGTEKPLVVEITERQFLADTEEARQVLEPFREFGIRLAIDDFGAGHSSLNYLAELPVEFLKVEGSLVRRMLSERRVRAVVQGIQSLANDLGVVTVAEGIEDEATLDLLRRTGVDWGQGYLFGPPSTPDAGDPPAHGRA
jgi:diguanylate cyclase (GGDEF)-like protein